MQINEKKTILLVEDEAIISLSTSKILQKNGFNVITVHKGEKAIDAVRDSATIDIVLMDINLGKGMDGAEAAEKVLKIRSLPIVFLTSHSEQAVVDRIKSITRYGYVIKNSGEFVLLESINMALELFDANRKLLRDIKQRELAEAELKTSEVKFSTVFHASPAGICINDAENGRFIDANSAFETITGIDRSDLVGKDPWELGLWSDENAEEISQELQTTGKLSNREILYESKVTGNRNIVISCEFIQLNGNSCVLTVVNDITEQRLNLEALKESRKILDSTHKTAMLESWIYDFNKKHLQLSNKGSLSGIENKSVNGFEFFIDKTHPDDIKFHEEEIQKILDGKPVLFKVRLVINGSTKWFLVQADIEQDAAGKPSKAIGITLDITNSKATEEENLKHISILKATLESTADGILVIDLKGSISNYNKRFTEMWNIPEYLMLQGNDNEVIDFVLDQLLSPEEFLEHVKWLYLHPREVSLDTIYFKDGRIFERYSIPQIINDEIAGRVWNFRDATEKFKVESALKQSEERIRAIIHSVPDLMFVLNDKGVFKDYYSRTDDDLYVPVENFMGKHLDDIFEKDFAELASRKIESAIENNATERIEYSLPIRGELRYFEDRIAPVSDKEVLSIIRDITDEKKKEDALLVRENVLAKITEFAELIFNSGVNDESINHILAGLGKAFSVSRAYIFRKTFESNEMISFRQINEWCDDGVFSSSEVLDVENFVIDKNSPYMSKVNSFIEKGFLPGNIDEMDNEFEKYLMKVQDLKSYLFISIYVKNIFWGMIGFDECKHLRKWEDFEIQVLKTAANIIGGALQKDEAEKELAGSRELYHTLIDSSPDSVTVTDQYGNLVFASRRALELFGHDPDERLEGTSVFSWVAEKCRKATSEEFQKVLTTGNFQINTFTLQKKDGTMFIAEVSASRYTDCFGNPQGLIVVTRDITEKLELERQIAEDHIRRKILIDESGDGIVILDDKGKVFEANKKFAEMLGYTCEEIKETSVSDWDRYFSGEELKTLLELDLAGTFNCETVHTRKDGSNFDVEICINKASVNGKRLIFCVCRDITKRKAILQKIKESEERFSKIFRNSPVGISLTRISDGMYIDVNDALLKIGGYTREEVIGHTTIELKVYDVETRERFMEQLKNDGRVESIEHRFPRKDGTYAHVIFSLEIVELNGEKYMLGIVMDNTERKLDEIKLRESEEKFSKIFHSSPVGIAITKADTGEYIDVNKTLLELSGKKREELIGKTTIDTLEFSPEQRERLVETIMNNERVTYQEMDYTMPGGKVAKGAFFMDKFEIEGEKFILSTVFDITDKKEAEVKIMRSLQEKEILLKELQHRVKNNLAVISSLLHLEMGNLDDENSRKIFQDSITRINSLSAIYEQLYSTDDISRIDLNVYLANLIDSLVKTYNINDDIVLVTSIKEGSYIDLKRSVLIGLIFNELITNSLKYAYPFNGKGTINAGFSIDSGTATIYVKDEGVGIPVNYSIDTAKSLGLKLVKMLSDQLEGTLKIDSQDGTCVSIKFKI